MKSNDRLYKLSLMLSGALITAGFFFMMHVRLDGPVFLEHDITMNVTGGNNHSDIPVSLNYITNADDNRIVTWVEFGEQPDFQVRATENEFALMSAGRTEVQSFDHQWGTNYGQYNVRDIFMEVTQFPEMEEGEELLLTEATVTFSDGTSKTVDIGEMAISHLDITDTPLSFSNSFSTSSGQTSITYIAEENLSIIGVETGLHEQDEDAFRIEINGVDYQEAIGQSIQQGEQVTLSVTNENNAGSSDLTVFKSSPQLILATSEGEHTIRLAQTIQVEPDYSFMAIYRYLNSKEDI